MIPVPGLVFIIDDDAGVRNAVHRVLKSVGLNAEVFAEPQEFLRRKHPDVASCLVLDVRLPEISGLEVQRKLIEAGVHIPIIFITGHANVPMSVKAMKAGAVEFLTKPVPEDALIGAIKSAIARSRVILEHEAQLRSLRLRHSSLTPRERDVMALVVRGLLNKQVAGELGMAEITVKAHRGQVMRKMNAASFADLVSMAASLGLAAPERR